MIFLSGMMTLGYVVAGMFFLKFWRASRDRLFLAFAVAFALLAVQRVGLTIAFEANQGTELMYLLRLLAFSILLWAIWDKNRSARA